MLSDETSRMPHECDRRCRMLVAPRNVQLIHLGNGALSNLVTLCTGKHQRFPKCRRTRRNTSKKQAALLSSCLAIACCWLALSSLCAAAEAANPVDLSDIRECENVDASVKAGSETDHGEICRGAEDAIAFFHQLSLQPNQPIVVEIVRRLPEKAGETAVGCYLEDEHRILVLDFAEFKKRKTWFDVAIDRSMYRSLVAHEVAHAIVACHIAIPEPTIQAKEYLAYVAMFATMDQRLRDLIMKTNPDSAFDRESKINATIYLCDPMRFAVRAYRHFIKIEHGNEFLRRVLSGQALAY